MTSAVAEKASGFDITSRIESTLTVPLYRFPSLNNLVAKLDKVRSVLPVVATSSNHSLEIFTNIKNLPEYVYLLL